MKSLPLSNEVKYSQDDKTEIANQLAICLATQRTYGKQAADLAPVVRAFLDDLKEFPANKIAEAIAKWRKTSPEFPTPADIIALLKPPVKFDRSVYVTLNKRIGELSRQELAYVRAYENNILQTITLPEERKEKVAPARPATPIVKDITPEETAALIAEFNRAVANKPPQTIEEMEKEFYASETNMPQPDKTSHDDKIAVDIVQPSL